MDAGAGRPAETQPGSATPPIEPLPPGAAELLLAHSSDALIWYGLDGTIRWASPALERVFGWRPSDVIGTAFRLAPPDDRERSRAEVVAAIERGDRDVTVRSRAQHADGSVGWVDTAIAFIRDEGGAAVGSVASIRDVTAEVEAEERYRLLAENATDMVFIRDAVGTITWASPSTRAVLGIAPEDLIGTNTMDYVHPDEQPLARAVRAQVGSGETARGVVARIRRADGSYRYMSLVSHPVIDASGAVIGAVGGMKDVDDLVRARMQVEHERTLLRASSDSMLDPQVLLEAARDASAVGMKDVDDLVRARMQVEQERALLRASSDSMLDPQVLLEAVHNGSGEVVDFIYVTINLAACEYLHRPVEQLLGARLLALMPGLSGVGHLRPPGGGRGVGRALHGQGVLGTPTRCWARSATTTSARSAPVRACCSLTWSDVTERLQAGRAGSRRRRRSTDCSPRTCRTSWSTSATVSSPGCPRRSSPCSGRRRRRGSGRPMAEFVHPDDLEQVCDDVADPDVR